MKRFADLYRALDETTSTNAKVSAMEAYFRDAAPEDAAWAVFFLSGRRLKRLVKSADLWSWAVEEAELPAWLFEESYHVVGDTAETIALLLPDPVDSDDRPLHVWVEDELLRMRDAAPEVKENVMRRAWRSLSRHERFVCA